MAIDCHAHWIPSALAEALRKRQTAPRIARIEGEERLITYQGRTPMARLGDLAARRDFMQARGVAMQLLSLAGLFGVDCLPAEESLPLVAAFNDALGEACREQPSRFAGLASLPLADIALACRELERAHGLGLRGAILPADGFASLAAAERFVPLFALGDRLGSHFFIHPGPLEPQPERQLRDIRTDNAWPRRIVLATQARLSEVIVTLNLSDYLDPFPNLTVQVANLGGAMPFLIERMDEVFREQMPGEPLPSARMRRCYVDTASLGPRAIEQAVACFGADRVVLGTDFPIFNTERMMQSIAAARLSDESRDLLLTGNARRFLFKPAD